MEIMSVTSIKTAYLRRLNFKIISLWSLIVGQFGWQIVMYIDKTFSIIDDVMLCQIDNLINKYNLGNFECTS